MHAQTPTRTQPTAPAQTDHKACLAFLERVADVVDAALDPTIEWAECIDYLLDLDDDLRRELGRLRRQDGAA